MDEVIEDTLSSSKEFYLQWISFILFDLNMSEFNFLSEKVIEDKKLRSLYKPTKVDKNLEVGVYKNLLEVILKMKYNTQFDGRSIIESLQLNNKDNNYHIDLKELKDYKDNPKFTPKSFIKLLEQKIKKSFLNYHIKRVLNTLSSAEEGSDDIIFRKVSNYLDEYQQDSNFKFEMYESVFDGDSNENILEKNISKYIKSKVDKKEQHETVPTGYNSLDLLYKGGFQKKRLYIVAAKSGQGKSAFMVDMTKNFLEEGKCVYFFTFENSIAETEDRLFSSITGISSDEITSNTPGVRERLKNSINNFFTNNNGTLVLKQASVQSLTVSTIQRYIESSISKGYRPPDVIVIDYLDLLKSTMKTEERLRLSNIAYDLKTLSQDENSVVLTATQLNRESYKSDVIDLNNISESSGKSHVADSVIIFNSNPQKLEKGIIDFFIAKNRHGKSMKTIRFNVDFDTMSFVDTGVISSGTTTKEVIEEEFNDDDNEKINNSKFVKKNKKDGKLQFIDKINFDD